ncbi:32605_t:CDS:2 [Gigaspora margarita]|uniref:32605_t:CDS:1 n=1 Tax=Gigaspora margarita TaxID=4874 RepID=A0ABN7VKT0_GIGMA|nr:32605_t:CDS:2 [Gigaspora margarita]
MTNIDCKKKKYNHCRLWYTEENFINSYDDFDKAELCSQMIDIDFAVFLNSFLNRVETINEDERETTYIIIAFTTHLFDVFLKEQITVIAIDATYNTNQLKYELYVILEIIDRVEFPLTYLLLKPNQEKKHSKILLNWFYLIKEQCICYVQTFLTDKDFAQITLAQIVWPHA